MTEATSLEHAAELAKESTTVREAAEIVEHIPKKLHDLKAPYLSIVNAVTGELVGVQEWEAGSNVHLTEFKAAFIAALEQHNVTYSASVRGLGATSMDVAKKLGNQKMAIPQDAIHGMIMACQNRVEEAMIRTANYQGGWGEQIAVVLPFAYVAKQGEGGEATVDLKRSKPFVNGLIFTGVFRDEFGAEKYMASVTQHTERAA